MINYHAKLRQLLLSAVDGDNIPVVYEKFNDYNNLPCISYMENANISLAKSETLSFSSLTFLIKVWSYDLTDVIDISEKIDIKLNSVGFTRTFSNEVIEDNVICKILRYEAIGYEKDD